jgi:hypothetical protein
VLKITGESGQLGKNERKGVMQINLSDKLFWALRVGCQPLPSIITHMAYETIICHQEDDTGGWTFSVAALV